MYVPLQLTINNKSKILKTIKYDIVNHLLFNVLQNTPLNIVLELP